LFRRYCGQGWWHELRARQFHYWAREALEAVEPAPPPAPTPIHDAFMLAVDSLPDTSSDPQSVMLVTDGHWDSEGQPYLVLRNLDEDCSGGWHYADEYTMFEVCAPVPGDLCPEVEVFLPCDAGPVVPG
jgi:hypothetical protein